MYFCDNRNTQQTGDYNVSTATNSNVTGALIAIQASIAPLKANQKGGHGKFADLLQVMQVLQPHLEAEKLAIIQRPIASASGSCTLETILRHQPSGEEIASTITIPMQRQNDPQAFGAAMTYGRRYSLLCIFGMVTEDDDAASASYSLEKLLRELSAATSLDELNNVKSRHFEGGFLNDKFWAAVYRTMHDKKYTSLMAVSQQNEQ
jgi:hypothetical protein